MKVFCSIVLTLMISLCVSATPVKLLSQRWETPNSLSVLEKIISDIPEEDRKDFVKHCIATVLKQKYVVSNIKSASSDYTNKFKDVEVPVAASNEMYEIVQTTYKLSDDELLRYVTYGPICFPSGCVDPGDIGSLCCPFRMVYV